VSTAYFNIFINALVTFSKFVNSRKTDERRTLVETTVTSQFGKSNARSKVFQSDRKIDVQVREFFDRSFIRNVLF